MRVPRDTRVAIVTDSGETTVREIAGSVSVQTQSAAIDLSRLGSDVTIKNYPTLNHLFMAGEGKATPAEYERPGQVAPFVIDDIAAWLTANVRK